MTQRVCILYIGNQEVLANVSDFKYKTYMTVNFPDLKTSDYLTTKLLWRDNEDRYVGEVRGSNIYTKGPKKEKKRRY